MLRVQLLGGLALHNGRELTGAGGQRKSLVLLALIASAPAGITREKLLGYLWPDVPEDRGQNSLRQRLFALRRDLGEEVLFLGTSELRLNPEVATVDLWDFNAAFDAGDMTRAATVYGGPFLDGVFLKESDTERWIEDTRAELSKRATRAFSTAATEAAQNGDQEKAVALWRRLVSFEPTAATPAAGLMTALAESGDAPAALSHYRLYCTLLKDQYELEPDPRVASLADAIRAGAHRTNGNGTPNGDGHADGHGNGHASDGESVAVAITDRPEPSLPTSLRRSSRRRGALLIGAALLAVSTAAYAYVRDRDADAARAAHTVLVTTFRNETGVPELVGVANNFATAVAQELSKGEIADVIDGRASLPLEERRADTSTPAQEIGRRVGAGTVVTGAIRMSGDSLYVVATLIDVATGVDVQATPEVGAHRDSAAALLQPLARKVAGTIASLQDPMFTQLTGGRVSPPNLDAYREFRRAMVALVNEQNDTAYTAFMRALRLDTSFVQAALFAAEVGASDDSLPILLKYVEDRLDRLTALDRARWEYQSASSARELERAYRATGEMVRLSPNSWQAQMLRARRAFELRYYAEASRAYQRIDINSPGLTPNYFFLAQEAHHYAGEARRGLVTMEAGLRLFPGNAWICTNGVRALVLTGQTNELRSHIRRCAAMEKDSVAGRMEPLFEAAREAHAHGNRPLADSLWRELDALSEWLYQQGKIPPRVMANMRFHVARYADACPLFPDDAEGLERMRAAVCWSMVGDTARSRAITDWIKANRRRTNGAYPWAIMARVMMAEGRPDSAMRLLQGFEQNGGSVARQMHAERLFEPLWNRPEWKAITAPR